MLDHLPLLALAVVLVTASVTDLNGRRIANAVCYGAIAIAFALAIAEDGALGAWRSVSGVALGLALLPVWLAGGLGAGDVKLAAVIGAFLGALPAALCIAIAFALALATIALAAIRRPAGVPATRRTLPFAPCLAAGTALTLALPLLGGALE